MAENLGVAESVKESTIGSRRYTDANVEGEAMQTDSPTYILCERIARAELAKAAQENRVRNPDAFQRKVRDNMLERAEQRGAPWLVEQAARFGVDIPDELREHVPSVEDRNARKPALCSTCGVCLYYREDRDVTIVEGWPVASSACGRGYPISDCHQFQERGVDLTLAGILA